MNINMTEREMTARYKELDAMSLEQIRATAISPYHHLEMLQVLSDQVGFWLEVLWPGGVKFVHLEVFAFGPEWVLVKQEGVPGEPVWVRWDKMQEIMVRAA